MRLKHLIPLCAVTSFSLSAADVELLVTVPENTPKKSIITLAGDFNSWDPTAAGFQLTPIGNNQYRYEFKNIEAGKVLNFKVTRGSWAAAEIAASGSNRDNRSYVVTDKNQTIEMKVADWADLTTKVAPSTVVGTVVYEEVELPTFEGKRQLRIYLPPDYGKGSKRYPVIYMTDGQNLYDNKTANAGEWEIDELMEKLAKEHSKLTSIVVGIDHAGVNRLMEYLPFPYDGQSYRITNDGKPSLGKGAEFADWLVGELKPAIDKRYRTKPGREDTTIMGSSMGGLISCYTALRHQETFSKAGCLSPAFLKRLVDGHLINYINQTPKRFPMKFHMDMGDNEFGLFGDAILEETEEVYISLRKAGFKKSELRNQVIKGGTHDEPSWRNRTEDILMWLNSAK